MSSLITHKFYPNEFMVTHKFYPNYKNYCLQIGYSGKNYIYYKKKVIF